MSNNKSLLCGNPVKISPKNNDQPLQEQDDESLAWGKFGEERVRCSAEIESIISNNPKDLKNIYEKIKAYIKDKQYIDFTTLEGEKYINHYLVVMDAIITKRDIKRIEINMLSTHKEYADIIIEKLIALLEANAASDDIRIYLTLMDNNFNARHMLKLGAAFNKNIIYFCSIDNSIGNEGVKNLTLHIKETYIKGLDIIGAKMDNEGLRFLIDNLPKTIQGLRFTNNLIGDEAINNLLKLLMINSEEGNGISFLNLCKNKISSAGASSLIKLLPKTRIKDISFLDIFDEESRCDQSKENLDGEKIKIIGYRYY